MSKIAYCPNCKNMEEYSNISLKCKVCGSTIKGSYMDSSEWNTMSDSQKNEFLCDIEPNKNEPETKTETTTNKKSNCVNIEKIPSTTPDIEISDRELIKYLRRIAEDTHFIKTVVLLYLILSIIGALIVGITIIT